MADYIALIHKESGSDYGVSFPDFPGCVTAAATLDEAKREASEALALHVEGLLEDGELLPEPSSLEKIMADRANRDAVAFLMPSPVQTARTVRVNITLPEDILGEIDRAAGRQGLSRSAFLVRAARRAMDSAA